MKGRQKSGGAAPPSGVDLHEVQRLLDFMAEHGLEEVEYARGDLRIRLRKSAANSNSFSTRPAPVPESVVANPVTAGAEEPASAESPSVSAASAAPADNLHITKSPIVGTFFAAPTPGEPPFVQVGDTVAVGQVLCIIEAMKLMNEIESDVAGQVVRAFVENGQPVEYGEPLFAIRPTGAK